MEMSKQNCYKKSNITIDNTNCIPRFVPNNNKDDYDKILINKTVCRSRRSYYAIII